MSKLNQFMEQFAHEQDEDVKKVVQDAVKEQPVVPKVEQNVPDQVYVPAAEQEISVVQHVEKPLEQKIQQPKEKPHDEVKPRAAMKLNFGAKAKSMHVPAGAPKAPVEAHEQPKAVEKPALVARQKLVEPKYDVEEVAKPAQQHAQSDFLTEAQMEEMFIKSGTDSDLHDQWIAACVKASQAKVKGRLNTKVRMGKFRLTKEGLEILPDMETWNLSSKEILSKSWMKEG